MLAICNVFPSLTLNPTLKPFASSSLKFGISPSLVLILLSSSLLLITVRASSVRSHCGGLDQFFGTLILLLLVPLRLPHWYAPRSPLLFALGFPLVHVA